MYYISAAADAEKVRPQLLSPLQAVNMDATTVTTLATLSDSFLSVCLSVFHLVFCLSVHLYVCVCVWNVTISLFQDMDATTVTTLASLSVAYLSVCLFSFFLSVSI